MDKKGTSSHTMKKGKMSSEDPEEMMDKAMMGKKSKKPTRMKK